MHSTEEVSLRTSELIGRPFRLFAVLSSFVLTSSIKGDCSNPLMAALSIACRTSLHL